MVDDVATLGGKERKKNKNPSLNLKKGGLVTSGMEEERGGFNI